MANLLKMLHFYSTMETTKGFFIRLDYICHSGGFRSWERLYKDRQISSASMSPQHS